MTTVRLFGLGVQSKSPAITAQKRVNCYTEIRRDAEKSQAVLIGRPGLTLFTNTAPSGYPTRGMLAVNSTSPKILYVVQGPYFLAVDTGGNWAIQGFITSFSGPVSMATDGTSVVVVDGQFGWVFTISTSTFTKITDANFTTTPTTVTWQDTYFIVTSSGSKQFQLSNNSAPATWPAVNINFAGSGSGNLVAGIAEHSVLALFGEYYTEFWQDAGTPDFPYAFISGAAQEYGLAAQQSLTKFDNSLVGIFKDAMGGPNISRMRGYGIHRISTEDIDTLIASASTISSATGYALTIQGHPMYVVNAPDDNLSLMYDGVSNSWSELQSYGHNHFIANYFQTFNDQQIVSDHHSGNLYVVDTSSYSDNGNPIVMAVQTPHIWNEDKYIGISRVQVDMEQGVGNSGVTTPVADLQVSKDGGNSFYSVGYSSIGKVGEYTQRTVWNTLGAARDWVLRLVVSDPAKRVITGATAEITGASF